MTYRGHIRNGLVALDEPTKLPEGAEVLVHLAEATIRQPQVPTSKFAAISQFRPIELPGGSLADEIIRDRR